MKRLILISAALLFSGCATDFSPSRTFTPQQINQNIEAFDGRTVRIRGFVTIGFENRTFHQSKALWDEMRRDYKSSGFDPRSYQEYCLTLTNALDWDLNLPAYNHKTVELIARVHKDYGAEVIDLGACAIDTGIEVVRLLSVMD